MQDNFDVIVIGSGPAGAHSAYPLVKAGLKVAMIDGGIESPKENLEEKFQGDFEDVRHKAKDQYRLFLGDKLSGIAPNESKEVHVISMAMGNRQYISDKTKEFLPIDGKGVQVVQSLAKGGLCEIWAALSDILNKEELREIGISDENIMENYQEVINRIGMSGSIEGIKTQQGVEINSHAKNILKKYSSLSRQKTNGFTIEKPILAIVTKAFKGREPFAYKDLEYVANIGNSIYRPRFTIEELERETNFTYLPGRVALSIKKEGDEREIIVKKFDNSKESFSAKYIVLAAGSLNSTKILLKSFSMENVKVPFITKTHFIIPCFYIKTLGKKDDRKRSSLCQLVIKDISPNIKLENKIFAQLYSYKAFLLFKLAKYIPLPAPETIKLLSILAPSFIMLDIRFPSFWKKEKNWAHLNENGSMEIEGSEITTTEQKKKLGKLKRMIMRLGILPLKTVQHPFGSTAHYAGGIPCSESKEFSLRTDKNGQLNKDSRIYVADSATWQALPAKPPTLTIMANANQIGKNVLKEFNKTSTH